MISIKDLDSTLSGLPRFRIKQIKQAIFKDLIIDWSEAKWLPEGLRLKLTEELPLTINAENFYSKDNRSIKALIILSDGLKIETVLLKHLGRNTVCVSSQIGCPIGCKFCATGKMGFKRNLTTDEIVSQVLYFARLIKKEAILNDAKFPKKNPSLLKEEDKERINNLVFMGMGEPFLNYENVITAIRILNDQNGLAIGSRHISISTVGIIDGIKRLAKEELQVNLAISLHAPNDDLRIQLIPLNVRYNINKICEAVADYIQRTNRKVMFEYLMINDFNDSNRQAEELASLLNKFKKPLFMVNLIRYNETGDFDPSTSLRIKPSTEERIKSFKDILIKNGIMAIERFRFGETINAACGQLATKESTDQ